MLRRKDTLSSLSKIALLVPVYNEEKYLRKFLENLLREVKKFRIIRKIVIINDGSSDKTTSILSSYKNNALLKIITHHTNQGKGSALRSGLNAIRNNNYDAYIFMDADNQHSPTLLPTFIDALRSDSIVFGYRELGKKSPLIRKLGNNIARFIFRNFFHIKRRDLLCGYMAFRKEVLSKLKWQSKDYGIETELSSIISTK